MTKFNWKCWLFGHKWISIPTFIGRGFMVCKRCDIVEVED
jgi:hypothetical protein